MAELFADEGTNYAEFIFDELTKYKHLVDNVLLIKVGSLEAKRVWPWMKSDEYPSRIEFEYGKSPEWNKFNDSIINNKDIVKKYKIREQKQFQITNLVQEGSQKNSILLDIEFASNMNTRKKLSATILGTSEATMIDGIETVMNLSVPFEINVTPFMKTPRSAIEYYGKYNIRKEVDEILSS